MKQIDVICLDNSQMAVQKRYDDFIDFNNYRFKSGSVQEYLLLVYEAIVQNYTRAKDEALKFDGIEMAHKEFFTEPGIIRTAPKFS